MTPTLTSCCGQPVRQSRCSQCGRNVNPDTGTPPARSWQQSAQDHNKTPRGRFAAGPKCEACGKPAGHDYTSLETCNEDAIGVVLCRRRTCPGRRPEWRAEQKAVAV